MLPSIKNFAEKANAIRQTLTGDFKEIEQMVEANDLVAAVWSDAREPSGIGFAIVKGTQLLEEIITTGIAQSVRWTAIPCISAEQAAALQQVLGRAKLH